MIEWISNNGEAVVAFIALVIAVEQFRITRRFAKMEKRMLLYSKFFYLQSMFTTAVAGLVELSEGHKNIPVQDVHEFASAYKLDVSVFNVILELSDLSYVYFENMNVNTAKNVQNFLGNASETYHAINGYYGMIEKGDIDSICKRHKDIAALSKKMEDWFRTFKDEMYIHCVVSMKQ